jgi:7-carboxy-7-deazaguanine synthase
MRIAEIYVSLQGEGLLTGRESIFIRTSGCNLRCWFCDTPYTSWSPEGNDLSVAEILDRSAPWASTEHVVITGGEPMLQAELTPLTTELHALGKHITIETAGTLDLPVACDLMSISPKRANSTPTVERDVRWHVRHERDRHAPDVVRTLIAKHPYQVKFVIDAPADCDDVEAYLAEVSGIDRSRVLLMPQGTTVEDLATRSAWLEPHCARQGLTFCPRKHIEWFGFARGT